MNRLSLLAIALIASEKAQASVHYPEVGAIFGGIFLSLLFFPIAIVILTRISGVKSKNPARFVIYLICFVGWSILYAIIAASIYANGSFGIGDRVLGNYITFSAPIIMCVIAALIGYLRSNVNKRAA